MTLIMFLTLFVLIATTIFAVYTINVIGKNKLQDAQIESYRKKDELQRNYYRMLINKNEEIRHFRHDYHFYVNYLNQQCRSSNYKEIRKCVEQLMEKDNDMQSGNVNITGNDVIDAVICGTVYNGENEDIKFSCDGKLENDIGIKDVDLISLMSNALENAVEACKKCVDAKEIKMSVRRHKENIIIIIENTYLEKTIEKGIFRATSKEDYRNHGYGRINMKKTVDLYDGEISEDASDGKYKLTIQLNETT